jgi:uncharacterized protein YyaL (SSP411 family)
MGNEYTNALIHESSPYLQKHAHNPVNWYPWHEETLLLAKKTNKPILLSIGYSACHWCHVMEDESFENITVAAFMNEHFINIKVDREERPDLDLIYMEAVQILTGSGGWPLNVFLNCDGKPFYGGTYFPIEKIHNRPSWMDVLYFIKDNWEQKRAIVEQQATKLLEHIVANEVAFKSEIIVSENSNAVNEFTKENCEEIKNKILSQADRTNGGFGHAPKFPQFFSIQYLLNFSHFYKDDDTKQHAFHSLKSMLNGGIYDHLAGGLARYSTDENWLVPHFEKMLNDNALLIITLCDAYSISNDECYKLAIEKNISFCLNELHIENQGFLTAIDADSEGIEGLFYVWKYDEIVAILGDDASIFCKYYNISKDGNWEGYNILNIPVEVEIFAQNQQIQNEKLQTYLKNAEEKLLSHRKTRIRPATDDKIILSSNALMIIALCKAFALLGNEKYKQKAIETHQFIQSNFIEKNTTYFHTHKNNIAKYPAFLDDYAYFIQACIQLQEITGDSNYLIEAKEITNLVIQNFKQSDGSFFYYTNSTQTDIVTRKIDKYDSAIPSGNSVMADNLNYLSIVFDIKDWKNQSFQMILEMLPLIKRYPNSFSYWGTTFMKITNGIWELVLSGTDYQKELKKILSTFLPNKILISSLNNKNIPLLNNKDYDGKFKMHVCKDFQCFEPLNKIEQFEELFKN